MRPGHALLGIVAGAGAASGAVVYFYGPDARPGSAAVAVADPLTEAEPLVIPRPRVDLGVVTARPAPHLATFRLLNRGSAEVVIGGLEKSCGCVDPLLDRDRIPPGGAVFRIRGTIGRRGES